MENNDENAFYFEDSPQSPTHSTTVTISSSPKQIKNRAELIIKCFKWKHSFKKALYNEFFDYESKDFNIYEFKASGYRGTLTDHFTHVTYEPDEENTVLSAFSTNSVEDIPIPFELDTSKYDVVVGNIGRITKPYVIIILVVFNKD